MFLVALGCSSEGTQQHKDGMWAEEALRLGSGLFGKAAWAKTLFILSHDAAAVAI